MRDPNRIDAILERLRKIWKSNPELRLGQLISNAVDECEFMYQIEDEDLMSDIEFIYLRR